MWDRISKGRTVARTPKPWYNAERNAWYVTIKGKRHRLAENKKEADRAFYSLMVTEGEITQQRGRISVADAVETLIESVQHHRDSTKRIYVYSLGPFAARFASRKLDSITPDEVITFVSTYVGAHRSGRPIGDSSRCLMFRHIKTLFRWARDIGLLAINPMHGKTGPWRIRDRARGLTPEEYHAIMGDSKLNDYFKEVLEFLWRTGARPGEIAKIEARHLDAHKDIVRLQPTEHKTGTKTGKQRELIMPPDLMARLRAYAVERPKGPLLLGIRGRPWNQGLLSKTFSRTKKRLGLPDDSVLYLARHSFVTRVLNSGTDLALAAKLVGHANAEVIQRTYYHPDVDALLNITKALNVGEAEKLDEIREQVEQSRQQHRDSLKKTIRAKAKVERKQRRTALKADKPADA
jgi:integrase